MDIGSLSIGIVIWFIIIGILYLIGVFIVDKISERQCWLESSKQLGYVIVGLLIGIFTNTLIFLWIIILISFLSFIITYKREKYLISIIESQKAKDILLNLNKSGFYGIGNFFECLEIPLKSDDIKIIQSVLKNYKCRNLIDIDVNISPGTITKLQNGIEWNKDFCK